MIDLLYNNGLNKVLANALPDQGDGSEDDEDDTTDPDQKKVNKLQF